jgi:hypothetical protein
MPLCRALLYSLASFWLPFAGGGTYGTHKKRLSGSPRPLAGTRPIRNLIVLLTLNLFKGLVDSR